MKLTIKKTHVTNMQEAVQSDRKTYIGGSDAGAVAGVNPYKSRYALWCEKTGKIVSDIPDNDAMKTGRDLEDYVARRFTEATGKKVRKDNYKYTIKEYPFMVGHVDRRVEGENALLECKTANTFQNTAYEAGEFPQHYKAQCMHYMAVTGAERIYLGVLCFPHFYWTVFERNEDEIERLIRMESEFWDLVTNDQAPAIDGSDSTEKALFARYPVGMVDNSIQLDSRDAVYHLLKIDETKNAIKDLQETCKFHENYIKSLLGDAVYGTSDDYRVSWKEQSRTTVDGKKLQRTYPEIYEEMTNTTSNRVFRITRKKDKKCQDS